MLPCFFIIKRLERRGRLQLAISIGPYFNSPMDMEGQLQIIGSVCVSWFFIPILLINIVIFSGGIGIDTEKKVIFSVYLIKRKTWDLTKKEKYANIEMIKKTLLITLKAPHSSILLGLMGKEWRSSETEEFGS